MRRLAFIMVALLAAPAWAQNPTANAQIILQGAGAASSVSAAAFPLLAPAGTVGAPSYAFSAETTAGFYRDGTVGGVTVATASVGRVNFASALVRMDSAEALCWSSSNITQNCDSGFSRSAAGIVKITNGGAGTGTLLIGDGTVSLPAVFGSSSNSGIYFTGSGVNTAITSGGVGQFGVGANIVEMVSTTGFGWQAGALFGGSNDTQFIRVVAGVAGASAGSWWQNTSGEGAINADYTNATTTFSNTNLSRTLLSGRTYSFDVSLYPTESTAADGWKIDFNGGSAAATYFNAVCFSTAETGIIVTLANGTSAALATVINATTTTTTGIQLITCHGTFVPSGAGTFIVRAAQNAHSTGTLTLKRGSALAMRDSPAL